MLLRNGVILIRLTTSEIWLRLLMFAEIVTHAKLFTLKLTIHDYSKCNVRKIVLWAFHLNNKNWELTDGEGVGMMWCGGGEVIVPWIPQFLQTFRCQVSEHGGHVDVFLDGRPQQSTSERSCQQFRFLTNKTTR